MSDDLIYIDLTLKNSLETRMNAELNIVRASPILLKPEQYEMSIIRFDINTRDIPTIKYNNGFNITYFYNNVVYTENLIFPANLLNPGWYQTPLAFVLAINNTFERLHTRLHAVLPALIIAPLMYIKSDGLKIAFEEQYRGILLKIYFSTILNDKLIGFPINNTPDDALYGSNINYQSNMYLNSGNINLPSTYSNITTKIYILDNYTYNLDFMNDIRNIYMTSNNIPITQENTIILESNHDQNISRKSENIITDFIFYYDNNQVDSRNRILYLPTIYRFINLMGSEPLFAININVFYETYGKESFLLKLNQYCSLNIKVLFKKKSLI